MYPPFGGWRISAGHPGVSGKLNFGVLGSLRSWSHGVLEAPGSLGALLVIGFPGVLESLQSLES